MNEPQITWMVMPEQASDVAANYDQLFFSLTALVTVCFVLIIGAGIYFVVKYRARGPENDAVEIPHNTVLEVAWSVIPLLVCIGLFAWGFKIYLEQVVPPKDALEIRVTGQKWNWVFEYPDGTTTGGKNAIMGVPINKPVKLIITSRDVLHSFFVPSFRNKMDAVPNRYTTMWFKANKLGDQQVFCAEYCGTDHSDMMAQVRVMTEEKFAAWLKKMGDDPTLAPEKKGEKIFAGKGGCTACHAVKSESDQPQPVIGPRLYKAFGRSETLTDGTTVTVDDNYVRESIEYPNRKTVAGFQAGAMPTFKGVLTDKEISDLIAYIKSLK